MPFYSYNCRTCKKTFKAFHSPDESQSHCIICKNETLDKVLPMVRKVESSKDSSTAKNRVEKFIEESKETLKEQKEEARKELK